MRQAHVTLPELGLFAVTRIALGVGIGFLLGSRVRRRQRERVGFALVGVGALSTIPLVIRILRSGRREQQAMPFAERPRTEVGLTAD
jgi:hypothetical protein